MLASNGRPPQATRKPTKGPEAASAVPCPDRSRALGLLAIGFPTLLALLNAPGLPAAHGFLMPAYTAAGAALAGAGTARVGDGGLSLAVNPALLALEAPSATAGLRMAVLGTSYTDSFQAPDLPSYRNRADARTSAVLPYFGAVGRLGETAVGFAAYAQGGSGLDLRLTRQPFVSGPSAEFSRSTPFPLVGETLSARLGAARFALGAARTLGPVQIGLSVDALVGRLQLERGETVAGQGTRLPGSGFRFDSKTSVAPAGSVGLHWKFHDSWALGASYQPPIRLSPDGSAQVGVGNPEFYRSTNVSVHQTWPSVARLGVARSSGAWNLYMDVKHLGWAYAFRTLRLDFADAWIETPLGSRTATVAFRHRWRDQVVAAVGVEWDRDNWLLRAGYNYGRTPTTPEGLNPLFGTTTEHHFSAGAGVKARGWRWEAAVEYAAPRTIHGAPQSDWAIAHTVLGPGRVYLPFFQYSKRTWTASVLLGVTRLWEPGVKS